ncbi:MAG: GNAT family N-acetyltransferase, partial [Myxococcota bacterium]
MSDDVHEYDSRLELRLLRAEDYPAVAQLQHDCFPGVLPWSQAVFEEQLRRFPEGQVGITFDGQLAVTSSALLVTGSDWDDQHTLEEVSSGGTIRNHEPDGDTLYGIDLAVAREHRGKRLARRIYEYRRALMQRMNVRRMFIAGRIPGLQRHPDLTPEVYVQQVLAKEFADPTMTVQLAMGFYVLRVLNGYMPNDVESRGAAVLMEWINPAWMPHSPSANCTVMVG